MFEGGGDTGIDWGRVAELRDEVGVENFDEVIALFLEEADDAIRQIQAETDPKLLESQLHFLKGAALNLGFSDLAALCQAQERQAAMSQIPHQLDKIEGIYAASRCAFLKHLPAKGYALS
jgi:histidine phosphotransfer protein HptB